MAENYIVNYQINVNEQPALQAIQRFQQATQQLEQLTKRFDMVARSVGKLNAALASIKPKPINVQVNTSSAEAGLKRVSALLSQIQTRSKTSVSLPDLSKLQATLNKIQTTTQSVNRLTIKPKANTQNAINSLDKLLSKLNQIKANKNITITATAAGAAGAVGAARGTRTSGKTPVVRLAKETGAGHSTYLYPSTRQVLGPTYANTGTNVAGEMIKGIGIAYGLSSLMSGVSSVFRDASSYENISQTTKNILGAHDNSAGFEANFNQMNRLMRQVGVETKFTAPQVASAGKFLAMAGYKTDEIKQSIRPISNLALIGDTDLGETADVTTNIMTGYEIPASRMNNVADILTMTFTKSNTTLMELAESFKYAGTMARQSGLDFETTAAAIGVLGDAGVKASHAGTTLRMMLMNMQAPTKKQRAAWKALGVSPKDSEGNLKDFNTLMSELNEKSKQMSGGDFTSLFYQAFRVTAATGALALVRHADKIQEITNLNKYNSFGLSNNLADAKKNTVEGLWYQMTSAFTESGMQGFESMQSVIRDFLQRMIQLMKSPEFVDALRNGMNMFLKLINAVVDVFRGIMKMWNLLPNWAKDGLVYFVKIQMSLGIIAGIGQSILSTWLMIRGVIAGDWLSKFLLGPISRALTYMVRFYKIEKLRYGLSTGKALAATVLSGPVSGVKNGLTGWLRTGSAVAGGVQGAGFLGKMGVMTVLGGFKSLFSWLLTSPVGIISSVALGIGAIAYKIWEAHSATKSAIKANEAWGASYRKLGIDRANFENQNDWMLANMSIMNSRLLNQTEKTKLAAEAWHKYWVERNGPEKQTEDSTPFVETEAGKHLKEGLEALDKNFATPTDISAHAQSILSQMGGFVVSQQNLNKYGRGYSTYSINMPWGEMPVYNKYMRNMSRQDAVQLYFAQMGADSNNEQVKQYKQRADQLLMKSTSVEDFDKNIGYLSDNYIPELPQTTKFYTPSEAMKLTKDEIQQQYAYIAAIRHQMLDVNQNWTDMWRSIMEQIDTKGTFDIADVQNLLYARYNWLFDPSHGLFGSDSWMKYVQDVCKYPEKYGLKDANVEQIGQYITGVFDDLLNLFNTIPSKYQPAFASFLYQKPWQAILPTGTILPEGGLPSGNKIGDTWDAPDGKKYTWTNKAPYATPQWVDKLGNVYSPSNSKGNTWVPNTNGSNDKSLAASLHNGSDQSQYKSHYNNSAAPKQVIVKIDSLMKVDKQMIDMTDGRQVAAVENIKETLASALLDVVQDFNANIIS